MDLMACSTCVFKLRETSSTASCCAFRATLPAALFRARKVDRQNFGHSASALFGVRLCPRYAPKQSFCDLHARRASRAWQRRKKYGRR